MKAKLYYPFINVQNEDFLKLSLLYFDKLSTIVPQSAEKVFSKEMICVKNNTDLLMPINPGVMYRCTCEASAITIAVLENVLQSEILTEKYRCEHNSIVRCGKYNFQFYDFCKTNGLGYEDKYGLHLNDSVAYEYMANLANAIAEEKGMDIITDTVKYADYRLAEATRHKEGTVYTDNPVLSELRFIIPTDIRNVPLEKIIAFRNDKNVVELRQAFQKSVEDCDLSTNATDLDNEFRLSIMHDMGKLLRDLGVELCWGAISGVSAYELVKGGNTALTIFAMAVFGQKFEKDLKQNLSKEGLGSLKDRQKARRYLANIKKIPYYPCPSNSYLG